ncbi:MAG: hypothetical protein J0H22_09490 [Actinobacteria bacterium]|nr:hypothetical protein [Actinomycetota bacterium]
MARKEIDPVRAKSALAVAKQHPGMILFLASPAIIAVVLVGVFAGTGWAVLLALALLVAGGVVLRRNL